MLKSDRRWRSLATCHRDREEREENKRRENMGVWVGVIGIEGKGSVRNGRTVIVYGVISKLYYSLDNIYLDYYPRLAENEIEGLSGIRGF